MTKTIVTQEQEVYQEECMVGYLLHILKMIRVDIYSIKKVTEKDDYRLTKYY